MAVVNLQSSKIAIGAFDYPTLHNNMIDTIEAAINAAENWDNSVLLNQAVIDTAADVVTTNADVVLTNADVVTTNADAATTTQDAIDTAADAATTAQDAIDTAADAAATALDKIATNADVVITNADVVTTNADAATTTQDAIDTAADLVATNQDSIDTAADVVTTGNNATTTNNNVIYSEQWANANEDVLVSVAAGGNGTNEYSAKHWSIKTAAVLASKANLASPTFTGTVAIPTLNMTGQQRANTIAIGALDIPCNLGNYFTKAINGNSTFTFSSAPAGSYSFVLELTHTSGAVTWPASVQWPNSLAPAFSTGKTHIIVFITDDSGTRWRASSSINYVN
jgi:hypothetical protein